jgi:antirestriction protein
MLKASPVGEGAEEYAIHDYEGYGSYQLAESASIQIAHDIACFIKEHGEIAVELVSRFSTLDKARTALEENYSGCYESLSDYAQEITEETSEIPNHLEFYIDYEKMGRDMERRDDIFTIETGYHEVHVFWRR